MATTEAHMHHCSLRHLAFTLTLLSLQPTIAYSQFTATYDPLSRSAQVSLTGSLPAISLDMPLNVMATYIVADTLCKAFDQSTIDSIADNISTDSLSIAFNAIIAIQNYSTLLYQFLRFYTEMYDVPSYRATYETITSRIEQNYYKRIRPMNFYDSLRSIGSGGIYHVRVASRIEFRDSIDVVPHSAKYIDKYYAELQILSTIFGSPYPWFCTPEGGGGTFPCARASWARAQRGYGTENDESDSLYYSRGPGKLEPGEEYIVLIQSWAVKPLPNKTLEFELFAWKVFHVLDETVFDPENSLQLGTTINLDALLDTLYTKINNLY